MSFVYAITDVIIQDMDVCGNIPFGYTGIGFVGTGINNPSLPYIPSGQGSIGKQQPGDDIQDNIGGHNINIFVKYEYIDSTSQTKVLTGIQSLKWGSFGSWNPYFPDGYPYPANNSPFTPSIQDKPKGAVSGLPGTNYFCSSSGLVVAFEEINKLKKFVSTVGISRGSDIYFDGFANVNGEIVKLNRAVDVNGYYDIHNTCRDTYYYYMVWGESDNPGYPSGWYTIKSLSNPDFSICAGNVSDKLLVGSFDSSFKTNNFPLQNLWYYDASINIIYNPCFKSSLFSICGSTLDISRNTYKSGATSIIINAQSLYASVCKMYVNSMSFNKGIQNLLKTQTNLSTKWSITKQPVPALPNLGNFPVENWYSFILANGNCIWYDSSFNLISSPIDSNKIWYYNKNNRIYTFINNIQYFWPVLNPINQNIKLNNDWVDIKLKLVSGFTESGYWNINKIDVADPSWKFKPSNLNNNTSFFSGLTTNLYLVFDYFTKGNPSKTVMYPSPFSFYDILSTINVLPAKTPITSETKSGDYYLIDGSKKCLTDKGTYDNCTTNTVWNYNTETKQVHYKSNPSICITSDLNNNCIGNPALKITQCSGDTRKYILGTELGEIYDISCQICYNPRNPKNIEGYWGDNYIFIDTKYNPERAWQSQVLKTPMDRAWHSQVLKTLIYVLLIAIIVILLVNFFRKLNI